MAADKKEEARALLQQKLEIAESGDYFALLGVDKNADARPMATPSCCFPLLIRPCTDPTVQSMAAAICS